MGEHRHGWADEGAVYLEGRQREPRMTRTVDAESTTRVPYDSPHGRRAEAGAFLDAVRSREAPPATARDADRVAAITAAAYEAARTDERMPVELPSVGRWGPGWPNVQDRFPDHLWPCGYSDGDTMGAR